MARASVSKSAVWKARTTSGSSRSDSAVNPVRSAKSTVTWRRSASRVALAAVGGAGGAGGGATGAVFASPGAANRCPQRGQNAKSGGVPKPQPVQIMVLDAYDSTDEGTALPGRGRADPPAAGGRRRLD